MSEQLLYLVSHHEVSTTRVIPESGPVTVKNTYVSEVSDYHKIGIAEEPSERLSSMQSGTPNQLELVTTVESDDPKEAEKHLHSILRRKHHRGEWFKLTSATINSLKGLDYVDAGNLAELAKRQRRYEWDHDKGLYVQVMELRGDCE